MLNEKNKRLLNEKKDYYVAAKISEKDEKKSKELARCWGLYYGIIFRRLLKQLITKKISLLNLMRSNTEEQGDIEQKLHRNKSLRIRVTEKEYTNFIDIALDWDLAPGTLARLLMEFFVKTDKKTRDSLWL